jgi:YHS domain-containing protein
MNTKCLMMMLAVLGLSAGFAMAHEGHDHSKEAATKATTQEPSNAVEVGNKLCPVTGNPVDDGSMGEPVKYEYKGKIYTLCCLMCEKDFKKDPEKYRAIAEKEVKGRK